MTDSFKKSLHNFCSGILSFCRICALQAKVFFAAKATQRFFNFPLQGFNLLPYRHLRAQRCRRWRRSEFALAACIGLIIASIVQYRQSSDANRAAQNEKNLQRQLDELQPQLAENQRLNTLMTTQQRRIKALTHLTPERLALTTLLNALSQFKETNVSVTQLKIESGVHTICGIASDYAALSQWVQFLKQTANFANVEVTQVQHRMPPNTQIRAKAITPIGLTFSVNLSAGSSSRPNPSLSDLPKAPKKSTCFTA